MLGSARQQFRLRCGPHAMTGANKSQLEEEARGQTQARRSGPARPRAAAKPPPAPAKRGAAGRSKPKAAAGASIFAGLRPNAANFAPLTPVSFLPRIGRTSIPTASRSSTATRRLTLPPALRARAAAGLGAGAPRRARRRHGLGHAAQRAGDARGPLRRADAGRRAQHHQHAARRRDHRLYPAAWRSQGADHRPRIRRRRSAPRWRSSRGRPLVIDVDDPLYAGPGERLGEIEYEDFIAAGDPDFAWSPPADETSAIALNYTSGTTGNPKGVVYHHRGTFLEAVGNIMAWPLPPQAGLSVDAADVPLQRLGLSRGRSWPWAAPMSACARSIRR